MSVVISCPNFHMAPKIDVYTRDKNKCIIKCPNCGEECSVKIEDLINSKTEYTNRFIPKCSRKKKHEKSIPNAEKICEKCGYYFCKSCGEIHESDHEDDDEPHKLKPINGIKISKCKNHNNMIECFCKSCQSELCLRCSGHEKHEIVKIYDIINSQQLNTIDKNIIKAKKVVNEVYKEIKDKVINKFTAEINYKISKLKSELQNSIQQINDLYSSNVKTNNNLIELIQILMNIYKDSSNNYYTCFNLINNAHFNFSILKNDNLNDAINFFKSNYILDIQETKKTITCIRCDGKGKVEESAKMHERKVEKCLLTDADKYGIGNENRHYYMDTEEEWVSNGTVVCPLCEGNGKIIDIYYEKCTKCFGKGFNQSKWYRDLCSKCRGAGYFI